MAESLFQFNPEPVRGGSVGADGSSATLGTSGGGNSRSGVVAPSDWGAQDFNAGANIPEFILKAVEPKMQAQARKKMYEGFAAARVGKTQEEINEESPWYGQLFGQTNYQLGATTYIAMKAGADAEQEYIGAMDELRKLPWEQVAGRLNEITEKGLTGDMFADAQLQKNIMDRAGPMLDLHTRERYAWQQSELSKAQLAAVSSGGRALQEHSAVLARLGTDAPLDPNVAGRQVEIQRNFAAMLQKPEGQDDASYKRTMEATIDQFARNGDWYALQTMDKLGVRNIFDVEEQSKLDGRIVTLHAQWEAKRIDSDPAMIERLAKIGAEAAGGIGGQPTMESMLSFNNDWMASTGSPFPYYKVKDVVAKSEQSVEAHMRRQERAEDREFTNSQRLATEQEKRDAEVRNRAQINTMFLTGTAGNLSNLPEVSMEEREAVVLTSYRSLLDSGRVDEAVGALVYNFSTRDGLKSAKVKEEINHQMELSSKDSLSNTFMRQYELYQKMKGSLGWRVDPETGKAEKTGVGDGDAAANYYFGDYVDEMENFGRRLRAGDAPDLAYRAAVGEAVQRGDIRGRDKKESAANLTAFTAAKEAIQPSSWASMVHGKEKFNRSANALLDVLASKHFESLDPTYTGDIRATQAVRTAINVDGFDYAGQYAWQNPSDVRPMYQFFPGQNRDSAAIYVERAIGTKLRASGVTPSDKSNDYTILRLPDGADGPKLMVYAHDKNGNTKAALVTAADLKEAQRREIDHIQHGASDTTSQNARDDIDMGGFVTQPLL